MSVSEISKISHLFRIDNYLICVYTPAKGKELKKQLKSIFYAIDYASEGRDSYAVEKFVEWFDKIEKQEKKNELSLACNHLYIKSNHCFSDLTLICIFYYNSDRTIWKANRI